MDGIVNIIMIAVGLYLLYTSRQLIIKQNLRAFYTKEAIEKINPEYYKEFAYDLGKALIILGSTLFICALLFFLENVIKNKVFFWIIQFLLYTGMFSSFYLIYKANKKYERKSL